MDDENDRTGPNAGASAAEIQRHYDVGNEFYGLWLDAGMNYSCALWEGESKDDDLSEAQRRKLAYHIESANAAGKRAVLDIGCGWGALLHQLTQVHHVERAVGLTLSAAQAQWIRQRGIPGVEVREEAWQDHAAQAHYDAIISIGAFEHFARPGMTPPEKIAAYRAFFEKCASWLSFPGRLSLQTIAHGCVGEAKREQTSRLSSIVFPGSELPRLQEIIAAAEDVLKIGKVVNHAEDYQHTCKLWKNNLKRNREHAIALHGESTYQHYVDYLQGSEFGFALGNLALYRIVFEKPRDVFRQVD
jgi:cyclopropane-fatty-acyl-phospholipid synthase